MKTVTVAAMILFTASLSPSAAQAEIFSFGFDGGGVAGRLTLTYAPNPNTGILPLTVPNPVDPIGSYVITDITGTFSNTRLGIANVAVTGIVPLNRVSPEEGNTYAPNSFSLLPVANGIDSPGGPSLGLHYDNLFYPGGSPRAAFDYPFGGGVFDIYGMAFTLADGNYVNFWSNGNVPPDGLNYGVAVTDRVDLLDYVNGLAITAVPEPATWATMIVGFGLIGAATRYRRRRVTATIG